MAAHDATPERYGSHSGAGRQLPVELVGGYSDSELVDRQAAGSG